MVKYFILFSVFFFSSSASQYDTCDVDLAYDLCIRLQDQLSRRSSYTQQLLNEDDFRRCLQERISKKERSLARITKEVNIATRKLSLAEGDNDLFRRRMNISLASSGSYNDNHDSGSDSSGTTSNNTGSGHAAIGYVAGQPLHLVPPARPRGGICDCLRRRFL